MGPYIYINININTCIHNVYIYTYLLYGTHAKEGTIIHLCQYEAVKRSIERGIRELIGWIGEGGGQTATSRWLHDLLIVLFDDDLSETS